jgi:hypothetical protein
MLVSRKQAAAITLVAIAASEKVSSIVFPSFLAVMAELEVEVILEWRNIISIIDFCKSILLNFSFIL